MRHEDVRKNLRELDVRSHEDEHAHNDAHAHGDKPARNSARAHVGEHTRNSARAHEDEHARAQASELRASRASVLSSAGLALLGGACCALPAALVVLGAGGAVASLMSAAPWLVTLSRYKLLTFTVTALALAYSWWRLRRITHCDRANARRLRWQRRVLWSATLLLALSLTVAYALPAWLRAFA